MAVCEPDRKRSPSIEGKLVVVVEACDKVEIHLGNALALRTSLLMWLKLVIMIKITKTMPLLRRRDC